MHTARGGIAPVHCYAFSGRDDWKIPSSPSAPRNGKIDRGREIAQ